LRELALHLLDIAENSVSAEARRIHIEVTEDESTDRLTMMVQDNGKGMSPEMAARVVDPFVTSRTTRKVGLGIPLLKAAAEACNGGLTIESELGKGTRIFVDFKRSHIDRMPLGDLAGTFITLLIGSPEVHWLLTYRFNARVFEFDSEPVREVLGDVPMTEPSILAYIRNMIQDGIREAQAITTSV